MRVSWGNNVMNDNTFKSKQIKIYIDGKLKELQKFISEKTKVLSIDQSSLTTDRFELLEIKEIIQQVQE